MPPPSAPAPCKNCGALVVDRYCGACGQSRRSLDVSLWGLLGEALAALASADGRLPRTLRLLATRPGAVTAAYLAGQRVRFTPPIRLYLGASFAFFGGYVLTRPVDRAYYGLAPDFGGGGYEQAMARLLVLLLPLAALVLKAAFLRQRRPAVHHLVFSLHFGAAALLWTLMLMLLAALMKAGWGHYTAAPQGLPDFVYLLYLPGLGVAFGYLAAALRRAYGVGWAAALAGALAAGVALALGLWGGALYLLPYLGAG